jgi:cystinosin
MLHSSVLEYISITIGWIYFGAWSLSFYPQLIENWWRRSVVGLSCEFLAFNFIGHTCYMIFNTVLFWSTTVQREYLNIHPNAIENPVKLNDIFFSIHAVTLTALTIGQCFIYERGHQRISWTGRIIIILTLITIAVVIFLGVGHVLSWFYVLQAIGIVKLVMTFIKYVPQAHLNFKRKSTVGWSIGNIILDFTGGLLSLGQMFIDAVNSGDWTPFYVDIPKLGLALLAIGFDILFIVQHYCLYKQSSQTLLNKANLDSNSVVVDETVSLNTSHE